MDKLGLLRRAAKAADHTDPVEPDTLPVEPDRSKYAEDEASELGYAKDMRDYIDALKSALQVAQQDRVYAAVRQARGR
jgi:hypothetical protein